MSRIGFTTIIVESLACQVFLPWTVHWFPWMIPVVLILWILRVWTIEQVKENEDVNAYLTLPDWEVNGSSFVSCQYKGVQQSFKSSLIILGGSFLSNRTYQFMAQLTNKRDSSRQGTGFLLLRVEETFSPLIRSQFFSIFIVDSWFRVSIDQSNDSIVSCCSMCRKLFFNAESEYHLEHLSSQEESHTMDSFQSNQSSVLSSVCLHSFFSSFSLLFHSGVNSNHFTADQQFFSSNPSIDLWRFEVVYSFPTETSSSALNFVINPPPSNGSCSISPRNGTTLTLFSISCPSWFDADGIKDYSLLLYSNASSSRGSMIAFSSVSEFEVNLPSSDDLRLSILVRDQRDCLTEWTNLSRLIVKVETNAFDDLLQSPKGFSPSNPFLQVLSIPNQNRVGQILSSLSQQINRANQDNLQKAVSSLSSSSFFFFDLFLNCRWRDPGREYLHLLVRLCPTLSERLFVECFRVGGIWGRFKSTSQSSRISTSISRCSSGDEQLEYNSNSIQLSRRTHSIDESTLSISSRTNDLSFLLREEIDLIVEFGVESMSSVGFVVVVDSRKNSSRRSSNVIESTRPMCDKSSHRSSLFLFDRRFFNLQSVCLGREWTSSTTNERFGLGSSRSQSSSVGLRNRFRSPRRSSIGFLLVAGNEKSLPTETIRLDIE